MVTAANFQEKGTGHNRRKGEMIQGLPMIISIINDKRRLEGYPTTWLHRPLHDLENHVHAGHEKVGVEVGPKRRMRSSACTSMAISLPAHDSHTRCVVPLF